MSSLSQQQQQTNDNHTQQTDSAPPDSSNTSNNSFATLIADYAYTESKEAPTTDRVLRKRKYTTESKATIDTADNVSEADTPVKRSPTKQSPTRRMIKGKPTGYTSPATYAHLSTVSDHLAYGMRVLFVGINPGIASSANQHHYANPANAFWPCLSASGLVTENVTCIDDHRLPRDYRLGLTNLVARPSRSSSEIRAAEFRAGRPILNAKIRKWRPLFVCFIGKGIFEHWAGRRCETLGLQPETVSFDEGEDGEATAQSTDASKNSTSKDDGALLRPDEAIFTDLGSQVTKTDLTSELQAEIAKRTHASIYCMPSSSGLAANFSRAEKIAFFCDLCHLVEEEEKRLSISNS